MRKVLLLGVLAAVPPSGCAGHRAATAPAAPAPAPTPAPRAAPTPVPPAVPATASSTPSADVFRVEVAPLLARRCAPCHNPGGKMYERLPFDDPATVAGHPEGILKRIKDPAEHALIERWIADQTKS
jgi:hypothetical protein